MKVFVNDPTHISGVCSTISWDNTDLKEAMERLFRCRPNETISRLDVSPAGIKATFIHVNELTSIDPNTGLFRSKNNS